MKTWERWVIFLAAMGLVLALCFSFSQVAALLGLGTWVRKVSQPEYVEPRRFR